tara:strand:- start:44 stop:229 length:186 start_codon:yes stop_codon:yes gene_type:complete
MSMASSKPSPSVSTALPSGRKRERRRRREKAVAEDLLRSAALRVMSAKVLVVLRYCGRPAS